MRLRPTSRTVPKPLPVPLAENFPLVSKEEAARLPVVIVLASGRGKRFRASGGSTHKLQADLGGKTVLQHTLDAVRGSGLNWHLEDAGHPGMGDSIAAAVRANQNSLGWMVLPADLPLIQPKTLLELARMPMTGEVLLPVFEGQRGHPVRFEVSCRAALMALRGDQGAAPVVAERKTVKIAVHDPGCVMDIDTVDDLQLALEKLQIVHQG